MLAKELTTEGLKPQRGKEEREKDIFSVVDLLRKRLHTNSVLAMMSFFQNESLYAKCNCCGDSVGR